MMALDSVARFKVPGFVVAGRLSGCRRSDREVGAEEGVRSAVRSNYRWRMSTLRDELVAQ